MSDRVALLAKLGQLSVLYNHLLGDFTNFSPRMRRTQFVLGNRGAKSLDPNVIFKFQEAAEC
jgi:hypothetical protein